MVFLILSINTIRSLKQRIEVWSIIHVRTRSIIYLWKQHRGCLDYKQILWWLGIPIIRLGWVQMSWKYVCLNQTRRQSMYRFTWGLRCSVILQGNRCSDGDHKVISWGWKSARCSKNVRFEQSFWKYYEVIFQAENNASLVAEYLRLWSIRNLLLSLATMSLQKFSKRSSTQCSSTTKREEIWDTRYHSTLWLCRMVPNLPQIVVKFHS